MKNRWFRILLPVPARELWGNSHCHHMKYHRYFKKAKNNAKLIVLSQERFYEPYTRGDVYITWWTRDMRHPDGDNALHGLKAYLDAFQAAGIIDNDKHFRCFPIDFTNSKVVKGGVVIRIFLEKE